MDCLGQTRLCQESDAIEKEKQPSEKNSHQFFHVLIQWSFLVLCMGTLEKKTRKCFRPIEKSTHIKAKKNVQKNSNQQQSLTSSTFQLPYHQEFLIFSAWLLKPPLNETPKFCLRHAWFFCLPYHLTYESFFNLISCFLF